MKYKFKINANGVHIRLVLNATSRLPLCDKMKKNYIKTTTFQNL